MAVNSWRKYAANAALYGKYAQGEDEMRELLGHKVVGMDSVTDVPAGAVRRLFVRPQVEFKVERILIPIRCSPHFHIAGIFVGKNSQTVERTAIPADVFTVALSKEAVEAARNPENGEWAFVSEHIKRGERFDMDVCPIGLDITMEVVNITASNRRFCVGLAGREVAPMHRVQ